MIIRLNNGQGVVLKDGICVLNTIENPWILFAEAGYK